MTHLMVLISHHNGHVVLMLVGLVVESSTIENRSVVAQDVE